MNLALEARQFLRSTRSGVLSTFSAKFSGYPFGSVTPFVLDHSGQPIVLISTIAEHTKNIIANPKVSILVFNGDEDLQASARLTLIGEAKIINKRIDTLNNDDYTNLRARYLRYFPQAEGYFDTHDFHFYRIGIAQARYIAGFGKMGWVTASELSGEEHIAPEQLLKTPTLLASQESAIIEHMNADHAHSLIAYSKHFHNVEVVNPKMLGIDADGFDVSVNIATTTQTKILRFHFDQPIHDAQSARVALVAMSKAAKV